MKNEPSRTFIGSVACIDLVGYSRRSVAQQMQVKQAFNDLLMQALAEVPPDDRIVLDTGDGAAIAFLGDPETCLATCIAMRDAMNAAREELGAGPDDWPMRIGINLGPMRLALDVNGRPNIAGDGVVAAERIMPLAKPGQIVASRSFHEMVSHISDDVAALFEAGHEAPDRTGQPREAFPVRAAGSPRPLRRRPGDPAVGEMTQVTMTRSRAAPAAVSASTSKPGVAAATATEAGWIAFLRDGKRVGIAATVLALVIAGEIAWLLQRTPSSATVAAATPAKPNAGAAPSVAIPPAAPAAVPAAPPVAAPKPQPAVKPAEKAPEKAAEKTPAKPFEAPQEKVAPAPPPVSASPAPMPVDAPKKAAPAKEPAPPREPARRTESPAKPFDDARSQAAGGATSPAPPPPLEPPREEAKPAPPTTVATPIYRPSVAFPVAVAAKGFTEGQIRARLSVNAAGAVTNVEVTASEPPRVFDRDAVRTLQTWKFNPGADNRTYSVDLDFKR